MIRMCKGVPSIYRVAHLLPLATLVVVLAAPAIHAADNSALPQVVQLRIGFAGRYQAGRWTPVIATIKAGSTDFQGTVWLAAIDGDGTPYRIPPEGDSATIVAGQSRDVLFHFKPAALENELAIEFVDPTNGQRRQALRIDDARESLRVPRAMPANERLIVGIGPGFGLQTAFGPSQGSTGIATRAIELSDISELPSQWPGYDAVDTLFVSTGSAEFNAGWSKQAARLDAMAAWVRQGGRLVLTIDREAETVLAPEQPLTKFVPGKFEGFVALLASQSSAWEEYAAALQPLPSIQSGAGDDRLRVPIVTGLPGKVEAPASLSPGQPPLVTRIPWGLGEVVFVAADLDQVPFARWSGRANLLRRLARTPLAGDARDPAAAHRAPIQHDLAEQLRRALDVFPGVRLVPFFWVAMLVIGYVALIGPGDFNLLRYFGQMERTWLTFPLFVIATSVGGYWFAGWLKGDQLRINQVDVIDIDADGLVRGVTIANVFSPETTTYDITVRPSISSGAPMEAPTLFMSTFALNPAALTGNAEHTTAQALTSEAYEYAPELTQIRRLPMLVWSSKTVSCEWQAKVKPFVEAQLTISDDELPAGSLQLAANVAIDDAWLVYGNTVTRLGRLAAGDQAQIGSRAGSAWSTLNTLLRYQRRVQKSPGKDEFTLSGTQWDAESTDVREIVRQIMFYDAAGGGDYTRAWNGALRKLDLSLRRDLGQAMLVGIIAPEDGESPPGAQLLRDGKPLRGDQDQNWTVVRIFIPVQSAAN